MKSHFKNSNAEDTMKETFLQDFGSHNNGYIKIAQFGQRNYECC